MQNAGKVGVLVVAFFAMLYAAYAMLGKKLFGAKPTTYYARFQDAGGVSSGTRILMAGVNIGTVTEVKLKSPTEAQMVLAVQPDISIPQGSVVQLPTSLTGIGENVVSIVPPSQPSGGVLTPGAEMVGVKQGALDSILPNGKDAVKELTNTLAAFRKILEDKTLTNQLKELMATTNKTMGQFGNTAASVNSLITSNQKTLIRTMNDASATMHNIKGMTDELFAMSKEGKLQGDLKATLANIREASERGNAMVGELKALISDPELQAALKGSAANMKIMTDSGVKIAANGESIAANVDKMAKDGPEISRKMSELMDKANEIATKMNNIADDVQGAVKKVSGTINSGSLKPVLNYQSQFDVIQESKPSFTRTDFTLIFPDSKGDSYQFGLYNAFEGNNLIAQIGKKIDDRLQLRYGIFASKPGFGVDYSFGPTAALRADVFSLNDPRFDVRLRYNIGKDVFGWFGMNSVFKDNAPTIGFGIRR